MVVESRLRSRRLAIVVPTRLGARAWLGCLILGSFLVRAIVAGSVRTPSYFPDEYIYSALSRSLATVGRPLVRGEPAHFPALLEPLLAAPLWLVGSTATAYRLVQFENALFMSLAAIPIYLLARRLGLGTRYALACAAFALALPDLVFSSLILSDPLAYPLVFSTLYVGLIALQTPSRRHQLGFVALAGLTTFARLQYVVLAAAFIVAALLLDRRAAWRLHRLPLALFGVAGLAVVALGPSRVLGFYHGVDFTHFRGGFLRWVLLDLLFLALAGGVAIVPGAVLGLRGGRDRAERAFAFLVIPFALALMVEAAVYAGNGSDRFKERYLFMILPLLPIAFGLYQRGRPGRSAVAILALAIAVGATLLPLASYARGEGFDDSPFLGAYLELQLASRLAPGSPADRLLGLDRRDPRDRGLARRLGRLACSGLVARSRSRALGRRKPARGQDLGSVAGLRRREPVLGRCRPRRARRSDRDGQRSGGGPDRTALLEPLDHA